MRELRRGDVHWVRSGDRRRPAVVVTRDSAIPLLNRVVMVPATRTIRGAPTEVRLGPADGMPDECVLSVDNIQVVRHRSIGTRITSLSPERMDEVCEAMAYAFGC